jgi:hypothetical protein
MAGAKRILLLTTTARDLDAFVAASEKLSLLPVIGAPAGLRLPPLLRDEAIDLDFTTRDSVLHIVESAQREAFAAIVAIDEQPATIAARAASMMGLACHPPKAADVCADREMLVTRLRENGVASASDIAGTLHVSALMTNGSAQRFVLTADIGGSIGEDVARDATALFKRAAEILQLGSGVAHFDMARNPLTITNVSLAASRPWTGILRFKIPLVDEEVTWPEAVIRNALALDVRRLYPA